MIGHYRGVEQKHNLLDVTCTLIRWKDYHWSPKPHNLSRHLAILWGSEGWHLNLGPRLDKKEVNPESRPHPGRHFFIRYVYIVENEFQMCCLKGFTIIQMVVDFQGEFQSHIFSKWPSKTPSVQYSQWWLYKMLQVSHCFFRALGKMNFPCLTLICFTWVANS